MYLVEDGIDTHPVELQDAANIQRASQPASQPVSSCF